jgi:hypothetical protein
MIFLRRAKVNDSGKIVCDDVQNGSIRVLLVVMRIGGLDNHEGFVDIIGFYVMKSETIKSVSIPPTWCTRDILESKWVATGRLIMRR